MKNLFIIANWKSNETTPGVEEWFQTIHNSQLTFNPDEKTIVICPPFTLLPKVKELITNNNLVFNVGAQNISPFDQGAYTGEANGKQIKEFADYVIIGHSERRKNFSENDEMLTQKVKEAMENDLKPIFCIQSEETLIPEGTKIVAYEPVSAIGTGIPDTPDDAEKVAKTIKEKYPFVKSVLYGGSVSPGAASGFTKMPSVDGVLVGGASLDAEKFAQIINNA